MELNRFSCEVVTSESLGPHLRGEDAPRVEVSRLVVSRPGLGNVTLWPAFQDGSTRHARAMLEAVAAAMNETARERERADGLESEVKRLREALLR